MTIMLKNKLYLISPWNNKIPTLVALALDYLLGVDMPLNKHTKMLSVPMLLQVSNSHRLVVNQD